MKSFLTSALGLVSLVAASTASATILTETYTYSGTGDFNADSTLTEGELINFGFDMISAGGLGAAPASFTLTEDSIGADALLPWLSGSLSMELYSIDSQFEITSLAVVAQNTSTAEVMLLDAFVWNQSTLADPIYDVTYNFADADMGVFSDWGWANVSIAASSTGISGFNDFAVSSVSMSVSDIASVPEPTTLALMSIGLIGLGFSRRRNKT